MRRFASLRRQADFARLRQRGRRMATPNLTVYRGEGAPQGERPLVGITVSTAVGKAVIRNKVKRRIAACMHDLVPADPQVRILVVARPSTAGATYTDLRSELARALA
jgi:ribonuclease P protein component